MGIKPPSLFTSIRYITFENAFSFKVIKCRNVSCENNI